MTPPPTPFAVKVMVAGNAGAQVPTVVVGIGKPLATTVKLLA
jgi:hypothetical protein